jgi:cell division septum initiation protein DivIVA
MDHEMENEVTELLEVLYTTVADARSLPLGKDKCMINRESVLSLLDEVRAQLPIELAEAKRLLAARDEFVSNAKREAETIRKAAEEQARRLVEEQEITRIARAHANEIIANAETKSRELVRAANDYVDDALRRTEEAVAAALTEVRQSRSRFRSLAGARSAAPVQNPGVDEGDVQPEE